jgi:hypothetical protein
MEFLPPGCWPGVHGGICQFVAAGRSDPGAWLRASDRRNRNLDLSPAHPPIQSYPAHPSPGGWSSVPGSVLAFMRPEVSAEPHGAPIRYEACQPSGCPGAYLACLPSLHPGPASLFLSLERRMRELIVEAEFPCVPQELFGHYISYTDCQHIAIAADEQVATKQQSRSWLAEQARQESLLTRSGCRAPVVYRRWAGAVPSIMPKKRPNQKVAAVHHLVQLRRRTGRSALMRLHPLTRRRILRNDHLHGGVG